MRPVVIIALCTLCLSATLPAQDFRLTTSADSVEARWVDSIFNTMTPDERLGQLIMVRAHSDKGPDHVAHVESLIKKYQVGSLCFFQGTPEKQVELTNRYQALTKHVPLMIAIDGEWGLGMRMKASTISFPRQLTLGAIQNNRLIYDMGAEVARQFRRIGIHINFAPVADINNNIANPVINTRSFGEDRYNVTIKSYMYMKGMQDNGLMACAKHFPGHGDTNVDSHKDLPVIQHDRARLDSIELYPFKALADYGIGSMMIAHLSVPALDDRENRPTSLSRSTVTDLLKEEIGFKGLIFTDALEMKGVTKNFGGGEVEAESLRAGNDILCLPESIEAALAAIHRYVAEGKLDQSELDARVKKVLRAKYRLGLTSYEPLPETNVREDLNTPYAHALKRRLIQEALTLVRNRGNLIPFAELDSMRLASLSIGAQGTTRFQERLSSYAGFTHLQSPKEISSSQQQELVRKLKGYDAVVVGIHDMSSYASRDFGLTASLRQLIKTLNRETRVILVVFGSPYSLKYFDDIDWLLTAYDDGSDYQDLAAQALFGAFAIQGRLPVTASSLATFNTGITTMPTLRFGYSLPEEVNINSDSLRNIGELVNRAIDLNATPGCVVLVAKDGKVIFEEAYGYHTYARKRPVRTDDVYDLASLTKVLASTLAIMKLTEEGKVDLDAPLAAYLPELEGSNKANLILRDVMAHRAGLIDWIPFYKGTVTNSRRNPQPLAEFYQHQRGKGFSVPVTQNLFLRDSYVDTIWMQIRDSKLRTSRGYKYSDLGFYLIAKLVERVSGRRLDQYVAAEFYRPLGLQTTTFRPWQHLPIDRIPPTEEDRYFRRQQVRGYVHDMGAAMLGGVSGHAGLFASAGNVAVIMQMLLQKGYYGGRQYLQPETVEAFTSRHPESTRRGIGFDMFQTDTRMRPNMSPLASRSTFGHTGFTGTCAWADPESGLVYVFLSNRTYPSMNNYKLNRMDVRDRIQSIAYNGIGTPFVDNGDRDAILAGSTPSRLPTVDELPPLPNMTTREVTGKTATAASASEAPVLGSAQE